MSKDEADKRITASEVGTFLIRFSASHAHKGAFIVVLKTPNGAEHHQVKVTIVLQLLQIMILFVVVQCVKL